MTVRKQLLAAILIALNGGSSPCRRQGQCRPRSLPLGSRLG